MSAECPQRRGSAARGLAGFALWIGAATGAVGSVARADDVGQALGRLSSSSAAERAGAERWLSAHLAASDLVAVASTIRAGDAEVRARIVEALSGEDRLLVVAAALSVSTDAAESAVGREALVESVERWSPGSKKPAIAEPAVMAALRKDHDRTITMDAALASLPLEDVLDLVDRGVARAPAIAVDPRCGTTGLAGQAFEGRLDALLSDSIAPRGLALRGFGIGSDVPAGAVPWIVVVPQAADADESAAHVLVRWIMVVASADVTPTRAAAARALAASGWPAAIAWLADRWSTQSDAAALEGVLLSARRERVASVLLQPAVQARLRAELERALAEGTGARAVRIAQALGATGTIGPTANVDAPRNANDTEPAPGGASDADRSRRLLTPAADLLAPALAGITILTGRALYVRLVELEARQACDARTIAALTTLLERPDVEPPSAWIALGMLSRSGASIPELPRAAEIVSWCATRGRLDELTRIVRGESAFPPAEWRDPRALPSGMEARARACIAASWLARDEIDAAVQHVEFVLDTPNLRAHEELAFALRDAARDIGPDRLERLFHQVIARSDPTSGETRNAQRVGVALRAAAMSGTVRTDELAARVLATVPDPASTRADLLTLGALAASPRGEVARTRFVAALHGPVGTDDALAAADRAVAELRAARDEALERAFVRQVRAAAREGPPELRARLRLDSWPAPPRGAPLRLDELDRSLARAGVQ